MKIRLILAFAVLTALYAFISWSEREILNLVMEALQEEAGKVCKQCRIEVEESSLSLLTRTGYFKNIALREGEGVGLEFEHISASFSLLSLFSGKTSLNLVLSSGLSHGVSPGSLMYRFVDQLTTAPDPLKPKPWIRVVLSRLELKNTRFFEPTGRGRITGTVQGNFLRTGENVYDLSLRASPFSWEAENTSAPLRLGTLHADIQLKDGAIEFKKLILARGNGNTVFSGWAPLQKGNTDLSGTIAAGFPSESLRLESLYQGYLSAEGTVGGSLGNPTARGSFSLIDGTESPLVIFYKGFPFIDFHTAAGNIEFDFNKGVPLIGINNIEAKGPGVRIDKASRFGMKGINYNGFLSIFVQKVAALPITAKDVHLSIDYKGDLDGSFSPRIAIDTSILSLGNVWLDGARFEGSIEDGMLQYKVFDSVRSPSSYRLSGRVNLETLEIHDTELFLDDARLFSPSGKAFVDYTAFNGNVTLSGSLGVRDLNGRGTVRAEYEAVENMPVVSSHKLTLMDGALNIKSVDSTGALNALTKINFLSGENSLALHANRFPLYELTGIDCSYVNATLLYHFSLDRLLEGNGTFSMPDLSVGCSPYNFKVENFGPTDFSKGEINVPQTTITGLNNDIVVDGVFRVDSSFFLNLKGDLNLVSLASFNSLPVSAGGDLSFAVNASKEGSELTRFQGHAELKRAKLLAESAGIFLEDAEGIFEILDRQLLISSFVAKLNGGTVEVSGSVLPSSLERSLLKVLYEDVLYEPSSIMKAKTDGALTINFDAGGTPVVSGEVKIDNAEVRKDFDLIALAGSFTARDEDLATPVSMPPIGLDVRVKGERNIFIISNFLEAELKADLLLGGSLAAPVIKGEMNTLNGWLGINEKQFNLTSGAIYFSPLSSQPELDFLAETIVRTRVGESIPLIMEATGPLNNPSLILTSDEEKSQQELFDLLTSSSDASTSLTGQVPAEKSGFSIFQFQSPDYLEKVFSNLARIDNFRILPEYNRLTATVQPAVTAEKWLSNDLRVVGQGVFGGNFTESRLKALLQLSNTVDLSTGIESSSINQNDALTVDVSFNVLSSSEEVIQLRLVGSNLFSTQSIRKLLRLENVLDVKTDNLSDLSKELRNEYENAGFTGTRVKAECLEKDKDRCSGIQFTVNEGTKVLIRNVIYVTDSPTFPMFSDLSEKLEGQAAASKDVIESSQKQLKEYLKEKGYLSASVRGKYLSTETTNSVDLLVEINAGTRFKFAFEGETLFPTDVLLNVVEVNTRIQSSGEQPLSGAKQRLKTFYQRRGYLKVAISSSQEYQASLDQSKILIKIDPGSLYQVKSVSFEGLDNIEIEGIKKIASDWVGVDVANLFEPRYAVPERIDYLEQVIKKVYFRLGFHDSRVTCPLSVDDEKKAVSIECAILEGRRENKIVVELGKTVLDLIEIENEVIPETIAEVNTYLSLLSEKIKERGFLFPSIYTYSIEKGSKVIIECEPGPQVRISEIQVAGNKNVSTDVIRKALTSVAPGAPWRKALFIESKRALLKLGLFTDVSFSAADGVLDSSDEVLKVSVRERPLQVLRVGTGANSVFGLHLFGEASDKLLFADGKKVSSRADIFYDPQENEISQGIASGIFTNPSLFGSDFSQVSDIRFQKLTTLTQEFDVGRISFGNFLYHTWADKVTASIGYTFALENISDVSPDAIVGEFDSGNVRLGNISGNITLDERDSALNPTSGYTFTFDYRLAAAPLFSEASFYSVGTRASWLHTFDGSLSRFSIGLISGFGYASTFGSTDTVPITQRYYLGGRNTVRGFRVNTLGPRGDRGSIIGGDMMQYNTVELRYKVHPSVTLDLFLDSGNVFLRSLDDDIFEQRVSVGTGFRYLSPIGPLGIDIGHPLDEKSGESSLRVHFSIGSAF